MTNATGSKVRRAAGAFAFAVTVAASVGAVGAVGSMAMGNTGRAPVTVDGPARESMASARMLADLARCRRSGSVGCHVERDTDGSVSVYGLARVRVWHAGAVEDDAATVAAVAACRTAPEVTACDVDRSTVDGPLRVVGTVGR